jgi:tetratricopeptide (TPR) repeat protein
MLADTEVSIEAKKFDLKRAIEACEEAIGFYGSSDLAHAQAKDYAIESAEIQMLLWAAYSGLAEVEDKAKNSKRAIEACMAALQIYEQRSQADHADAKKNLGYSYITLAEVEESAQNCQKAIDAYISSLVFYTVETAPMEHADILKDLAYAYVTLSEAEDREGCCKKALKAYKKAFKIFSKAAIQKEGEGDPTAATVRESAEKCRRSLDSCKRLLKASRKSKTS